MARWSRWALAFAVAATACARDNPAYRLTGAADGSGGSDGGGTAASSVSDGEGDGGADAGVSASGSDEAEGSGGLDGDTGPEDSGAVPSCDGEGVCIALPSDAWKGPFAMRTVGAIDSVDECPDPAYPQLHRIGATAAHDPRSCCECGLQADAECGASLSGLSLACGTIGVSLFSIPLDDCVNPSVVQIASSYVIETQTVTEASCTNVAPTPAPIVDEAGELCGGAALGSCPGGKCYARPDRSNLCITHPGVVKCADPFTERRELFDAAGEYTCPTCYCGPLTQCVPELAVFPETDCAGVPMMSAPDLDCLPTLGFGDEQSLQIVFDQAACTEPPDTAPAGDYTRENIVTVCCLP